MVAPKYNTVHLKEQFIHEVDISVSCTKPSTPSQFCGAFLAAAVCLGRKMGLSYEEILSRLELVEKITRTVADQKGDLS